MSESTNEPDSPSGTREEGQGITDDQLPDDLNPEKNPLARDPEDGDLPGGEGAPGSGDAGPGADAGQPG